MAIGMKYGGGCEGVMKGFKAYFETVKTEAQEEPEGSVGCSRGG